MLYRKLGNTNIDVSVICLGTMTWGEQNTEAEAHEQLDYAIAQGVNFIDTAEMYPVPPVPETCHRTEECIGTWLKQRGKRDDVIIATKLAGPGDFVSHIRGGSNLNKKHMQQAIEGSLKRLQTDYIDLYQLHWPERNTNYFGQLGYETHLPDNDGVSLHESLEALAEVVNAGKVRYVGISNETPWGTMEFLRLAEQHGLPRIVSIQNPYNLLNRSFEVGLAEVACREKVGLLAYSPLAFGALSGKYLDGKQPEGARLTRWTRFGRYTNEQSIAATQEYVEIAKKHGLSPVQMALAFINQRPFVTSNIIGATSMVQLTENIASIDVKLSDEVMESVQAVHQRISNPAP